MTSIWQGKRVRLRQVEPDDWETYRRFDEDSWNQRASDRISPPRSAEGQREWAREQARQDLAAGPLRLAVESLDEGVVVGGISTHGEDASAGRFSYGIALGAEYHRRGYASDALRILLTYMFGERRFHKCEAGVYDFNAPSLAFHRAFGFAEEGRLRESQFFAGRHHDVFLFGMTAPEFTRRHPLPAL